MSAPAVTTDRTLALVQDVFPQCPDDVMRLFADLLGQPWEAVVTQAQTALRKPYGTNHVMITSAGYGISLMRMETGQSTSLHYHERRRESFAVRAGVLRLVEGEDTRCLGPGAVGASRPGVPHALANGGAGRLEVLELFSPPLLEDKVRVADRYARALGRVGLRQ